MGSYKKANSYDARELMDKLSDIRETVAEERKKRLAGSTNPSMLSTFHSGQEKAKSKYSIGKTAGFGKKKWY
ncbi:MAG: hypothetical protein K5840_05260 [Eubacterium sp.]|nr:hypothetical protein [Eubacterium sp.]